MVKKKIVFLYLLMLTSVALFSQQGRSDLNKKLRGTWKKINYNAESYPQFLVFADRKHCKFLIINNPEYSNGAHETPFKYEIDKNGNMIRFISMDPKKPEISSRMIRFSSDTLIISVHSSIYFASDRYIRQ